MNIVLAEQVCIQFIASHQSTDFVCSLPQVHLCIAHAAAVQHDMTSIITNLALVASCQSINMYSNIYLLYTIIIINTFIKQN